ncbi:hydrogenase maturation protease [Streptomyces sp. NPDC002092]
MTRSGSRLLVAGVGNIFLADDAFGPEVIQALDRRPLPPEVRVRDFGIRGLDLAYELLDGYDVAVLVDAAARGHRPGTLSLIEPELPDGTTGAAPPEAHGMDPAKVLALAAHLGDEPLPRVLVLACEPEVRPRGDEDITPGISAPVREAVDRAVAALHTLVPALLADPTATPSLSRPDESTGLSAAEVPLPVAGGVEDR